MSTSTAFKRAVAGVATSMLCVLMATVAPSRANADQLSVARYIYGAAIDRGYSPDEATAIVAYAIGESGLDPQVSGGPQGGAGAENEVVGEFQEKPQFARDAGFDPADRFTVEGNTQAYLNTLEQHRGEGDIFDQLLVTSKGGPLFTGGIAAMGQLLDQARHYLVEAV